MKQQLITKENVDNRRNLKSINMKIKELKREFNRKHNMYIKDLYDILSQIVKLKQATDNKFAPRSLEWEEGLNLSSSQIRYIFAYQYISSASKKKVEQGLIKDSTICHFLSTNALLRDPQWQNEIVDKVIKEDINISAISELTTDEIKLYLQGKLKRRESDKYFLSATQTLRALTSKILERKHLLKRSPHSKNLFTAIKNLNEKVAIGESL